MLRFNFLTLPKSRHEFYDIRDDSLEQNTLLILNISF